VPLDYARSRGLANPRRKSRWISWRIVGVCAGLLIVLAGLLVLNDEREKAKQRVRAEAFLPKAIEIVRADRAFDAVTVSVEDVPDLGPTIYFFGSVPDNAAYLRLERIAHQFPGIDPAFVVFVNGGTSTRPS
jgi:hypothetical protein